MILLLGGKLLPRFKVNSHVRNAHAGYYLNLRKKFGQRIRKNRKKLRQIKNEMEKSKKWKNIILTNLSMTMTCQWLMVIKLLRTYRKTLAAAAAYSILSSIAARVLPYCHDCFITPATLILLACLLSVRALKVWSLGGSPGLVVMGDES